jgi:OOP family OmpA-OmpF porin
MKLRTLLFILFISSLAAKAQTVDQKNTISIGGGKECYNGHLGNSWFDPSEECYGFVSISYARYLNKSLDILASCSTGDIGRCREEGADISILNLYARMTTGIIAIKYKFANGYLLKENARLAPFLFMGGGINNLTDIWTHYRVNQGNYLTVNGGAGFSYRFATHYNLSYTLGFAYFETDGLDFIETGGHDMYMQHTFTLGYNF